jgi:hypothetical protein
MTEKEKTTQEFIKETLLPTQYKVADNIIQKMFPEKYREYRKFDAKLGTETIEGAFDIGATIVDAVVPEKLDPSRQERRQSQQDILKDFYSHLYGKDIITSEKKYGIDTAVAEPLESFGLDLAGDMAQLIVGGGLVKKGFKKALPKRKPKPFVETLVAAEVGSQIAFDPLEESLLEMIAGAVLPGNDKAIDDIESYIKGDEEDSRLKNRMLLFGDGLAGAGVFHYAGKGLKNIKLKDRFISLLNKIRSSDADTQNKFIDILQNSSSENAITGRVALKNRRKEIEDGTVKDLGDFEALQPSKMTRSELDLQFNKNPFIRKLETIRKKLFTNRGNKTLRMQEKFLKGENVKEMYQDKIANIGYNLENIYQEITEQVKNSKGLKTQIDEVLFKDDRLPTVITSKRYSAGRSQKQAFEQKLKKLPKELQGPVREARELQDSLSLMMLDTGYLTKAQKKIYLDSLGFYVRRSYKMFEDPNYVPNKTVLKDAEDYLAEQVKKEGITDPDVIKERVEAQIKDFSDINGRNSFGANLEKFDKIKKQILIGRKEIPKEIRAFLGEIDDPIEKFVHSATKLSKLVQDAKFYDETFEDGIGIYFRRNKEGIFRNTIPEGYGKLSGMHTSKELLQYFSVHKDLSQKALEAENLGGQIYRNLLLLKGTSQAAKTVWSHTTHVKNVAGGMHMSLANGVNVFDAKQTYDIIKTLRARTSGDKALQEFHEELSEFGLLNKGIIARDLKGLTDDISKVKTGNITKGITGAADWTFEKTGIKKLAEKAQNAYIAEDDFFKINMYIREEKNLTKINNMLPDNMKKSAREIKEDSARIVRDVLPNYDLVPEYFKSVRRFPLAGRFFSFMSESVRISAGTLRNVREDFFKGQDLIEQGAKEAGEAYQKKATQRLASFSLFAIGGGKVASETSQALSGLGQDTVDAIKEFLPDYMQNSNIIVSVGDDGTPMVSNLSSWDAYDYPKKPFQIMIPKIFDKNISNEDFMSELLSSLVTETVSPFLGESIIAEPIYDYVFAGGRDKNNRLMKYNFMGTTYQYNDTGSATDKIENLPILMGKLMESITPGSIDRLFDYTKTFGKDQTKYGQDIYELDQFMKFATGWGTSPLNTEYLENVFKFKSSDFSKEKDNRSRRLYNGLGEKLDYDKFVNNYIKENNEYYKNVSKFHKLNKAAEKFNINTLPLMKEAGLSKMDRVSIYADRFEPLGLGANLKKQISNADTEGKYIDVIQSINDIDNMYGNFPLMTSPENYKKEKEELSELRSLLRENYKTGGIVPNVQEDPADRVDPFTGLPYSEQMDRLGFSKGGNVPEGAVEIYDDEGLKPVFPVVEALGGLGVRGLKGAIEIAEQIVQKSSMPKEVIHGSSVKGLKEIKSANAMVRKPNEGLQSGIYTSKRGGISADYGFQGKEYPIDTSDISSFKNLVSIGKDKVINSKRPPKKFRISLDNAIKNTSSKKEVNELTRFKNSLGKKKYISDVGPTVRKFLDDNSIKVIKTKNRLDDKPTYILIEDMVKVKGK